MTLVEALARRDRHVLVAALVTIPLLCWAWIVPMGRDMYGAMTGPSAWMMTTVWDARHVGLLCAMWAVMMTGMMLPSAAPTLLIFAAVMRRGDEGRAPHCASIRWRPGISPSGAHSASRRRLQRELTRRLVMSPACLTSCRSPVSFIVRHMRPGALGAFRLGLLHGCYCLGCCWALMLLLFAGGVMNLTVIAALTVFVVLEKLAPLGWVGSWLSAVFLAAIAVWILTASA